MDGIFDMPREMSASLAFVWPAGFAGRGRAVNAATLEPVLAALMAAAQRGDRAAYGQLLHDCAPWIMAVARRQGVSAGQLEDVVQETLLTVHRVRHSWDPARPFLPWLGAIAARRAIDLLRRHGRQGAREVHEPVLYEAAADEAEGAGETLERADAASRLAVAVAGLPEGQREAVRLLVMADRSLKEAAAESGRSEGALKVNLHRAIRSLRERMVESDG
jgi:RNA polymerase sigma-70 factor (ECF subfamily)